ncbi:MAG: hypothetical protein FWH03_02620 [Firmicutes bacterium]|nr:hypothetical protein [Bacillota bacterium]
MERESEDLAAFKDFLSAYFGQKSGTRQDEEIDEEIFIAPEELSHDA